MFGRRPDGRRVPHLDPLVQVTPYLMPMRCDAQVFLQQKLDYELLARYITNQSAQGQQVTFLEILIASFVRAISQNPEVNRFILNKQYYSRKACTVSFVVLRDMPDKSISESTAKVKFDLTDTLYDVRDRLQKAIAENRSADDPTFAVKFAKFAMSVPLLPNILVFLIRALDRYGLLPGALLDELPFHTSLFATNMASIGMHAVYHHIYNFGSTSLFMSMGAVEREATLENGATRMKRLLPIGITADERVCAGAVYAKFFSLMLHCLKNPAELETPPETVLYDKNCEYHVPKVHEQASGQSGVSAGA